MSLDDFGTGASALNLLRVLPIDELKLVLKVLDKYNSDNEIGLFAIFSG